jgi:hypothetical protein
MFASSPGRLAAEAAKAPGVPVFASGEEAQKVAIGQGAQRLSAVAVVAQAVAGEDRRLMQAVFALQAIE